MKVALILIVAALVVMSPAGVRLLMRRRRPWRPPTQLDRLLNPSVPAHGDQPCGNPRCEMAWCRTALRPRKK